MFELLHDAMTQNKETFEKNVEKGKYKILVKANSADQTGAAIVNTIGLLFIIVIILYIVQYSLVCVFLSKILLNLKNLGLLSILFILLLCISMIPFYGLFVCIIGLMVINGLTRQKVKVVPVLTDEGIKV